MNLGVLNLLFDSAFIVTALSALAAFATILTLAMPICSRTA